MTPIILTHVCVDCIQNKASLFTIVMGGGGLQAAQT